MKLLFALTSTFFISILLSGCDTANSESHKQALSSDWKQRLAEELPAYGHRNWIVIADSAYPKQSNPAIETIYTGAKQTEVLKHVLAQIDAAPHIQGVVLTDSELAKVAEEDAPGIDAYRAELTELLKGKIASTEPHDDIIQRLDTDAKLFNVLLLKSDMVIPYTSVFIRLDCGYWNAEKEAKLRSSLQE